MCNSSFTLLVLLVLLVLRPEVWSYEAPEFRQDVFALTACPAFLTFTNAAYLAGVTLELPCHCKPHQVQSVVWFFRKHLGGSGETRALTDHHGNKLLDPRRVPHSAGLQSRFAIRLFSLLIFRAGTDDSGVYICGSAHKDFFYSYDLDIQEASEGRLGSARPLYRVFTSFRPWSVCDRCGVPGEQVRVGLCYVHSHFLHVRYRRANQTVASCGSGAVPRAFGKLKRSRVGAKLEVRSCRVICPKCWDEVATGALIGQTGKCLYPWRQVPVFYLSHPADRVLTLGCPGARANMAVAWDRGSEPIYRYEHASGRTLGAAPPRLLIDTGHHLLFNPAKIQDSGIYYCWLQGRQAAEIRLLVYLRLGRGQPVTSHPDFPVAVKTVLTWYAVMTAVFCILVFGRAGVRHLRDTHVD
uniref:Family with sequence similarity 187 member A n=1 Tax=Sparus aurata TaxID=8175 RepID=A0A671U8L2_SPAAU